MNIKHFPLSAINKCYKTLESEEGFKRCQEIVDEARCRVIEMVSMI